MKKLTIGFLLFSQLSFAKSVLISGFDAFDDAPGNNSSVIGKILAKNFLNTDISVEFCQLRTIYFKSSDELKDCYHSMKIKPDYIISLGETACKGLKFERRAINKMKDISQDNDGIHYIGEPIRASMPKYIPMSLDLTPLYTMLSRNEKKFVKLSKDQGTFVCNNLSYITASDIKETPYTFIHVPSYTCKNSKVLVEKSIQILEKTIKNLFNN